MAGALLQMQQPTDSRVIVEQLVTELLTMLNAGRFESGLVRSYLYRAQWDANQRAQVAMALRRIHYLLGVWIQQGGRP